MAATPTFRQLVRQLASAGQKGNENYRTIQDLAKLAGVSRAHFYHLLTGYRAASDEVIEKMAAAFRKLDRSVTEDVLRDALRRTQRVAELT